MTQALRAEPECEVNTTPGDGAEDVWLCARITWNAVPGASGYRVYIGTTTGGSEVVDGEEVTGTNFNPPAALGENTTYYIRVIPSNAAGRAPGSSKERRVGKEWVRSGSSRWSLYNKKKRNEQIYITDHNMQSKVS